MKYVSTAVTQKGVTAVVVIPANELFVSASEMPNNTFLIDSCEVGWITTDNGVSFKPAPLMLSDFKMAHDSFLNAPAKAKGYDSIHTAALRAIRPGPWQTEGCAFFDWMENCNQIGYTIVDEIKDGTRPMFATTAEYVALLPACPVV